jgi:transposase
VGASHARVEAVCRRHGVRVQYLPTYSPDLNPIEPGWALQKQHVRKHAPGRFHARHRVTPSTVAAVLRTPVTKGSTQSRKSARNGSDRE